MTATTTTDRTNEDAALWRAWFAAAEEHAAGAAVRELFNDLDARVRARGPTCWTSGKCCNFDAYGHKLYVTGLEIAWVVRQVKSDKLQVTSDKLRTEGHALPVLAQSSRLSLDSLPPACIYQVDRLCTIHTIRPMGCRIYFCQEGTQVWQNELYEEFLNQLRVLHDRLAIPYRYMEWRAGLRDALAAV